jgi:mevalonate kinase
MSHSTTTATASGKIILFGEHAVVYNRPAIAVPVTEVGATATVTDRAAGSGCLIVAHDLQREFLLATATEDDALALIVRLTLAELGLPINPDWQVEVRSTIPIASGLGSGAAVSTAIVRAIHRHVGQAASPSEVSALVYRSEEIHHGTPSGIDNTVIAYERPVWFVRGEPIRSFVPAQPFLIAIADSGIASPTRQAVGDVRRAWQAQTAQYEAWFDEIGEIVHASRRAIEDGHVAQLGPLMDANQRLLSQIGVSCRELDHLIDVARAAGAAGAKLSGGGRGGNLIASVDEKTAAAVADALTAAGAKRVIVTEVKNEESM